jgi:hypothetical protein
MLSYTVSCCQEKNDTPTKKYRFKRTCFVVRAGSDNDNVFLACLPGAPGALMAMVNQKGLSFNDKPFLLPGDQPRDLAISFCVLCFGGGGVAGGGCAGVIGSGDGSRFGDCCAGGVTGCGGFDFLSFNDKRSVLLPCVFLTRHTQPASRRSGFEQPRKMNACSLYWLNPQLLYQFFGGHLR